jgi:hypothetical protein
MSDQPPLNSDAKAALARARELAGQAGGRAMLPADLLVALLDLGSGAVRVLELFAVDVERVRRPIEFFGSRMPPWIVDPGIELPTVERARSEAAGLGHAEAGSEHLLLALAGQSDTIEAGILQSLGFTLAEGRRAIRFLRGEGDEAGRASFVPVGVIPGAGGMSFAPMFAWPGDEPPIEELERLHEAASSRFELGKSRLGRVVGIGLAEEVEGVLVELIALEIREAGAILHWRSQANKIGPLGMALVEVSDDLGTSYEVFPGSWGGGDSEMRGETNITPPPPPGARVLTVNIPSFGLEGFGATATMPGLLGMGMATATGPWHFEVAL